MFVILQPSLCAVTPPALSIQAVWSWMEVWIESSSSQQHTLRTSMPAFPLLLWEVICGHWGKHGSRNPGVLLDVNPNNSTVLQSKSHPWRIKGKIHFLLLGFQTSGMLPVQPHRVTAHGCLWAGSEMLHLRSALTGIVKCPGIEDTMAQNCKFRVRPSTWELGPDPSMKNFQCWGTGNGPWASIDTVKSLPTARQV